MTVNVFFDELLDSRSPQSAEIFTVLLKDKLLSVCEKRSSLREQLFGDVIF